MSEASFPVWFIRAQAGKEGFNKKQWHGVRYQDQSKGYTAPLVRVWEKKKLSSVESEAGWVRRAFLHRMSEVDKGEEGDPAKQPHQGTRVCAVKTAVWHGRCDSVIYNQFGHSVMCDSLRHHGLQHTRLPCPSPTPGACPNSSIELVMPSNHLILCCPLLLLPSIFPHWSFPMSQFFTSGGQSVGASASALDLPLNTQDWFPLQLTGLISLQSKGLTRVFSSTTVQKHKFFGTQLSLWSNSHINPWLLEEP